MQGHCTCIILIISFINLTSEGLPNLHSIDLHHTANFIFLRLRKRLFSSVDRISQGSINNETRSKVRILKVEPSRDIGDREVVIVLTLDLVVNEC
jgi:hypothetical protein